MRKVPNLKLILFFTALTLFSTTAVIFAWEKVFMPPFFAWVDARYPGDGGNWKIKQRTEHFFISLMVDVVVVTLLLRLVDRQQRKLAESEERYRTLFEHAKDGIVIVTAADNKIIEANNKFCEILGCRVQGVIGSDVREMFRLDTKTPDFTTMTGITIDEVIRATVQSPSGRSVPVSISLNGISVNDERLSIISVRDLSRQKQLETEKEQMQQQLFQSSKLASIGELSAGVAHEINNPLNGIINYAQLLKDEGLARNEFEHRMIDGIISEGERIAAIVRGLLTFARPAAHELSSVNISEAIDTSVALFGHQLEKDGIKVEIDVARDLPAVRADGSRLRQVVINMVSNAHHALKAKPADAPGGKLLRISARPVQRNSEEAVRVEFFDNGIGIRQQDMPKVFDPFFTTRRDTGGTGLGLSVSFGIIRDYDGTVTVESEKDRYTRFIVELPAVKVREGEYVEGLVGGRRA